MKRIYFTLLVAVVLGFNLCPQALAIRYSDVPEISWYSECVEKLSDAGVIGGLRTALSALTTQLPTARR